MTTSWDLVFRPNTAARTRLFTFPYAGAGPSVFRTWPDLLPKDVEVRSVLLPGRETRIRETPMNVIEPVVEGLLGDLCSKIDRPTIFFGHSYGAYVASELARALLDRGLRAPDLLILSACTPPGVARRFPTLHTLPRDEFARKMNERYRAIPEELFNEPDILELLIPPLQADMAVVEAKYDRPVLPPIPIPIIACGGRTDPQAHADELERWKEQTSSSFALELFEGGHFFLNDAAPKAKLLARIREALAQPPFV